MPLDFSQQVGIATGFRWFSVVDEGEADPLNQSSCTELLT